jgi:hypothetical protein
MSANQYSEETVKNFDSLKKVLKHRLQFKSERTVRREERLRKEL